MIAWTIAAVAVQAAVQPEESLATAMPPGFVVGYTVEQGPMLMEERIPKGESVQQWSRMVTVQRFRGGASIGARPFVDRLTGMWSGACPGAQIGPVEEGTVDGAPFAAVRADCPRNPATGKPETMFARVFAGPSDLHSVQYAFRTVPDANAVTAATSYLRAARICHAGSACGD